MTGQLATNERGYVCLSFDFDGPSLAAPEVAVGPTVLGRGGVGLMLGGRF